MKPVTYILFLISLVHISYGQSANEQLSMIVKTENGLLQGEAESGIRTFKGVPYAQPPIGDLRWKEPQPVKNWEGIRKADHFGPRAMQKYIYSDMQFRSDGVNEDCLYLNIWTSSQNGRESLPVLVYFYGGGFMAGDGSEYRYDGESMCRKGIVSVTVNYRLGIFGFLSHPELTKESPHHASGNYGLMDQTAALRWVKKNIAAFGGDPEHITIAGESAGSFSVNAQMVTPLSLNLFSAAIGESGGIMGFRLIPSLSEAEKIGVTFAEKIGVKGLKDLRDMPADKLLELSMKPGMDHFPTNVDGYFFPESPEALYKEGKIAKVPLLVGWNSAEGNWQNILGGRAPTKENYIKAVRNLYPSTADQILKVYTVNTDADVKTIATDLASDRFIAYGTWRWAELQTKAGSQVYRYIFTQPRPGLRVDINDSSKKISPNTGAVHSAEIEYALGNLPTNRVYDWQADDYKVSSVMQAYFFNFISARNPNGLGVPYWPVYQSWQKDPIMYIGNKTFRSADKGRDRYLLWEKLAVTSPE
jgi:para-nitrobenzyl esterase